MKSDLLSRWLDKNKPEGESDSTDDTGDFPLAYNQQALYYLCKLYPGNPFYNYHDYYDLKGPVNSDHLIEAFRLVQRKQGVFRTRILEVEGEPLQRVESQGELHVEQIDISQFKGDRDKEAKRIVTQKSLESLDLEAGNLLKIILIKLSNDHLAVGVITHHILVDKWSMGQLREQVSLFYKQLSRGEEPKAIPDAMSFGKYAKKQTESKSNTDKLGYWKTKLSKASSILDFHFDRSRPETPSFSGAQFTRRLAPDLCSRIKEFCLKNNATPFTFLLAAYNILLSRYTGNKHFNIGVPFTSKSSDSLDDAFGFFDETVVLHVPITKKAFVDYLEEVKKNVLEAFEQITPLELLVHELNPERVKGVNPLFQTMFIYHKVPDNPDMGDGLGFLPRQLDMKTSKFDLTLFLGEDIDGFYTSIEYATDLWEETTIEQFTNSYHTLLENILENPDEKINRVEIFSDAEREKIISTWNETQVSFQGVKSLMEPMSRLIHSSNNDIALSDLNREITYAELGILSDKIASQLSHSGIERGDVVGLHIGRNVDMIIAMIGVLKSGAAYLALDPDYPIKRLEYMVEDACVSLIITEDELSIGVSNITQLSLSQLYSSGGGQAVRVQYEADDLFYIVYTSGSTGRPKGVRVTHQNLMNSTLARNGFYAESPKSFFLFSSFSFDSSVAGIYWTLASGGKLVISPKRIEQDMDALARAFEDEQVSHTLLLPSLYNQLLNNLDISKLRELKEVIVAGENCTSTTVDLHFQKLGSTKLYNEYGPSETTVWSIATELQPGMKSIPIGKPIANTRTYLLDEDFNPVPPGVGGELYIGGSGVTEGYMNRIDETNEKFLVDPFNSKFGRVYKTGDRAKYDKEGILYFLGRNDEQSKIRGYRIELDEIERAILRFEGVHETLIIGDGDLSDKSTGHHKRLICFYSHEQTDSSKSLKIFLKDYLPAYMIPSEFHGLKVLPKLPNGKVDRKALIEFRDQRQQTGESDEPVNEIEKTLCEVWKNVLNLPSVGRTDNFFEIGGDSISSIRIIAKAKQRGIRIEPQQIFEFQTIAELSKRVDVQSTSKPVSSIQFEGSSDLSPIQYWFFENYKKEPHFWNQAIKITSIQPIEASIWSKAVSILVNNHDTLRQTFIQTEGKWKAVYRKFKPDKYTTRLSTKNHEESFHHLQDQVKLSDGPLIRLCLPENKKEVAEVTLLAHHLLVDMVSWEFILEDFEEIIEKLTSGLEIVTTRSPFQFNDWTELIHSGKLKELFEKQVDLWKKNIPFQSSVEPLKCSEEETVVKEVIVPHASIDSLRNNALESYGTEIQELLLIAFGMAVQNDSSAAVQIWTEKHGRSIFEDDHYMEASGWFTSFFPVNLNLTPDLDQSIVNTKEMMRSISHEGIGYGYLRYILGKIPSQSQPRFIFNYLGIRTTHTKKIFKDVEFRMDTRHPSSEFLASVEFNCSIVNDQLVGSFKFNSHMYNEKEMELITGAFLSSLDKIIAHCIAVEKKYTPSDFPEADLSEDDLDALLGQL